jgi:hypothetical protein
VLRSTHFPSAAYALLLVGLASCALPGDPAPEHDVRVEADPPLLAGRRSTLCLLTRTVPPARTTRWHLGTAPAREVQGNCLDWQPWQPGRVPLTVQATHEGEPAPPFATTLHVPPDVTPPHACVELPPQPWPADATVHVRSTCSTDDAGIEHLVWSWTDAAGDAHWQSEADWTLPTGPPGEGTLTLLVRDPGGLQDTLTLQVRVAETPDVTPPVARLDHPSPIATGTCTLADASASTDDRGPLRWHWMVPPGAAPAEAPINAPTLSICWPRPGLHRLGVRVTDDAGLHTEAWQDLEVLDDLTAPIAAIAPIPDPLEARTPVTWDGSLSTDDTGVVAWRWVARREGGDTVQGEGPRWTMSFPQPGAWTLTLTVSDGAGRAGSLEHAIDVAPGTAMARWLEPPSLSLCPGMPVDVQVITLWPDGSLEPAPLPIPASTSPMLVAGPAGPLAGPEGEGELDLLWEGGRSRIPLRIGRWLWTAPAGAAPNCAPREPWTQAGAAGGLTWAWRAGVGWHTGTGSPPQRPVGTPAAPATPAMAMHADTLWQPDPASGTILLHEPGTTTALEGPGNLLAVAPALTPGVVWFLTPEGARGWAWERGGWLAGPRCPVGDAAGLAASATHVAVQCGEGDAGSLRTLDVRRGEEAVWQGVLPPRGHALQSGPQGTLLAWAEGVRWRHDGTTWVAEGRAGEPAGRMQDDSGGWLGAEGWEGARTLTWAARAPDTVAWLGDADPARWLEAEDVRLHPSQPAGEGFANPANALGPARGMGQWAQNASSQDLYTLQDGEHLLIELVGWMLVDGPGDDLVVFENAFDRLPPAVERWAEPGGVEVSLDGVNWFGWPADAGRGDAPHWGVTPIWAHAERRPIPAGSPAAGGDRFDLARTGLRAARWIRLSDVPGDGRTPDLDAVAALHWQRLASDPAR